MITIKYLFPGAPSVLEDLIHQLMLWEAPPAETPAPRHEQDMRRTRCLALQSKSSPEKSYGLQCDENGG